MTLRLALRQAPDPELGALAVCGTALVVTAAIAAAARAGGSGLGGLWPFAAAGVLSPGLSQLFFVRAVRDAGAARTAVLLGTAPLLSVLIALAALREPVRAPLIGGALLIVGGGILLGGERVRPADFRGIGVLLALASAAMFATRDNLLRWLAVGSDVSALAAAPASLVGGVATLLVYLVVTRRAGATLRLRPFALSGLLFGLSYSALFEAYFRARVTVVSPLVATESLWGVLFAALLLRRSELISRRLVAGAALIVAGGAVIGALR